MPLLLFAVFSALSVVWLRPVKVDGMSMLPALTGGERVLLAAGPRFWPALARGDVIAFRSPTGRRGFYIKRIVGLPGETIAIQDGNVLVDGLPIEERYLGDSPRKRSSWGPYTVPAGTYFVLGDNRDASNDSRAWGALSRGAVWGRALLVYWPPSKLRSLLGSAAVSSRPAVPPAR